MRIAAAITFLAVVVPLIGVAESHEVYSMAATIKHVAKHHIVLTYRVRPTNTVYKTERMRITKKSKIEFTPRVNQQVVVTCMERGNGRRVILSMIPK